MNSKSSPSHAISQIISYSRSQTGKKKRNQNETKPTKPHTHTTTNQQNAESKTKRCKIWHFYCITRSCVMESFQSTAKSLQATQLCISGCFFFSSVLSTCLKMSSFCQLAVLVAVVGVHSKRLTSKKWYSSHQASEGSSLINTCLHGDGATNRKCLGTHWTLLGPLLSVASGLEVLSFQTSHQTICFLPSGIHIHEGKESRWMQW